MPDVRSALLIAGTVLAIQLPASSQGVPLAQFLTLTLASNWFEKAE